MAFDIVQNPSDPDPDTIQNTQDPLQTLSPKDLAILELKRADPSATAYQISKKLNQYGIAKNKRYAYARLSKKDYLQREFAEIERHAQEAMTRELYPIALKNIKGKLKDKQLPEGIKFNYNKLVVDKALGEKIIHEGSNRITIGQVDKIQVLVNGALDD